MGRTFKKSLKSKHKKEMRAVKKARNTEKAKVMIDQMIEETKTEEEKGAEFREDKVKIGKREYKWVEVKTASEIKEDAVMDTGAMCEFDPKTVKDKDGNFPKWMNGKTIKKMRVLNNREKRNTFKKNKPAGIVKKKLHMQVSKGGSQ